MLVLCGLILVFTWFLKTLNFGWKEGGQTVLWGGGWLKWGIGGAVTPLLHRKLHPCFFSSWIILRKKEIKIFALGFHILRAKTYRGRFTKTYPLYWFACLLFLFSQKKTIILLSFWLSILFSVQSDLGEKHQNIHYMSFKLVTRKTSK